MKDSDKREIEELQQTICNILNYILWLYEKKLISERTKNEIIKICSGNKGEYERKRNR